MRIKKILTLFLLVLCISTFFMPSVGFAGGEPQTTLSVDAVWLDGEMLQIDVTDTNTGEKQKLELRLKDYTEDSEYVSIQAVDLKGNQSNIVQIKNPYYKAPEKVEEKTEMTSESQKDETKSAIPEEVPFTVSGTGEVVDKVMEQDGKEFFTIKTANDNVFHLIIDRQRNSDNVYLLNAVTEQDLMALAEKGNGNTSSVIPVPPIEPPKETESPKEAEPPKEIPNPPQKTSNNMGLIIMILLVVLIVGAVGYYFKIYKPKQNIADSVDDSSGEYEDSDDDYEMESDDETDDKIDIDDYETDEEIDLDSKIKKSDESDRI